MDILTQGLLGAVLAQTCARQHETRIATGVGFASGLLADADVLIQSSNDPLLTLEFHRHFTHSLFFIPIGALIAALILWPLVRKRLPFGRLYLFSLLGYSLSGFLDACTSYGTHLLWPLVQEPISLHLISIIDPVFTLILLIAVVVSLRRHTWIAARVGLVLAGVYLLFGWAQNQQAASVVEMLAAERGHVMERLVVKPTLGNLLLWRSIYQTEGIIYVDSVRVGLTSGSRIYQGDAIPLFKLERDLPGLSPDSLLYQDILRFIKFSDGFVVIHPDRPEVLADIRYSNLPTSIRPLWGIEMDINHPERHAQYNFYRDLSADIRQRFLAMLFND